MWLHPVGVKENVQTYISPKLCLMPEIKSKYFRTGECVGIGQTTVPFLARKNHTFVTFVTHENLKQEAGKLTTGKNSKIVTQQTSAEVSMKHYHP